MRCRLVSESYTKDQLEKEGTRRRETVFLSYDVYTRRGSRPQDLILFWVPRLGPGRLGSSWFLSRTTGRRECITLVLYFRVTTFRNSKPSSPTSNNGVLCDRLRLYQGLRPLSGPEEVRLPCLRPFLLYSNDVTFYHYVNRHFHPKDDGLRKNMY